MNIIHYILFFIWCSRYIFEYCPDCLQRYITHSHRKYFIFYRLIYIGQYRFCFHYSVIEWHCYKHCNGIHIREYKNGLAQITCKIQLSHSLIYSYLNFDPLLSYAYVRNCIAKIKNLCNYCSIFLGKDDSPLAQCNRILHFQRWSCLCLLGEHVNLNTWKVSYLCHNIRIISSPNSKMVAWWDPGFYSTC